MNASLLGLAPLLAVVGSSSGSSDFIRGLFTLLMILLAALVLWALGNFLIPKFGAAPIVSTIWNCLFVLVGSILLINFFLGLAGHKLF